LVTAIAVAFAWSLLRAESQGAIAALIGLAVAAGFVLLRTRLLDPLAQAAVRDERFAQRLAFLGVAALALLLREDDFGLLLLTRVLIMIVACLGLNVQFGYAGVVNFAGASFFGVGGTHDAISLGANASLMSKTRTPATL